MQVRSCRCCFQYPHVEHVVLAAMMNGVLVLTGGPGTGKTHTLRAIVACWSHHGVQPLLVSPTGIKHATTRNQPTGFTMSCVRCLSYLRW